MNQPQSFGILGPDEFRKAREVFESAIELAPAERARFVDQSCGGDPYLIAEVQRMLAGDAEGNALLDDHVAATGRFHEGATFAGHFRVGAMLGRGGMGEVYRAHDVRLHRDVALKMLPRALALDPDRVARFKREAQVLASLNHPNIGSIYGLEESNSVHALALELVEGPTLADRLALGPIPIEEALSIARQIAVALQAAHEQGIVHRDLKPANIKAPDDGTVKVLDFGLAKLNDEPVADTSSPASLAIAPPVAMSADGSILGTAAYMSPEQARGKGVDKRTDIWAFGCVLFEMLTGMRAFIGDVRDTLGNVLQNQPGFDKLPSSVPPAIRTLLPRCLEKDRTRRVADAATLVYVLDEAASLAPAVAVRERTPPWLLATLMVAGILGCVLLWSRWPPSPPRPAVTRFTLSKFDGQLTIMARNRIAVSPDGSRLVYYSNGRAFLRDLTEADARPLLPRGSFFGQTAFSPDGRSLAVWDAEDASIKRMEIGGSAPVNVCRADNVFGMTWDQSGIVIGQGAKGIVRCPVDGRTPQQLANVEAGEEADGPQILPGGNTLLFTIAKTADGLTRWDTARIVVQSLKSRKRKTVVEGGSAARYVASGHLLYARGGVVFAVPFDVSRGEVSGKAVAVVEGVRRTAGAVTAGAQFAVSNTGHLFYIPGPANTWTAERVIVLSDRAGVVTRLSIPPGPYVHTRASRDGTRVAVGTDNGKEAAVWICRLRENPALQRLTMEGRNRLPIWSPDGTRVAFQSDRDGEQAIYVQRVDGSHRAERLAGARDGEFLTPESWSPDGRSILLSVGRDLRFSLWKLSVKDGGLRPLGVTSHQPIGATFSPDGRWIAYSLLGGPNRLLVPSDRGVFVQPFPATGAIYQAPKVLIDFHPVWASDGKELMYVPAAATGQLVTVRVTAHEGLTFGPPVTSPFRITANRLSTQTRAYDVLPDGRFVGLIDASEPDASQANGAFEIRVVLNWFEELKARVQPGRP